MKTSILLLVFAAAAAVSVRGAPRNDVPPAADLGHAFVTIPYSELRSLWEAGQRRDEAPKQDAPAPFVVHRADYRLQIGELSSALDAEYEVEALNKGWQSVPLVGGEVSLDKAEAGERSIIWKDGYILLANQPGKAPASLHFSAAGGKKFLAPGALKLRLGCATVNRLAISGIAKGMEARVNGRPADEIKDGVALFHLPSEGGEVTIDLDAPKVEKSQKALPPSQWSGESQVLARYGEGRLIFRSRLSVHADEGSGIEMVCDLPSNATAITIAGDDMTEWTSARSDDGRRRVMHVHWKTPEILIREVAISYEIAQTSLSEQWILPAPSVAGSKDARNFFAIVSSEGLEIKAEGVQGSVSENRLPGWMREEMGGKPFVTADSGAQLTLHTRWLPTLAAAEAIVSEAKSELRVVADGSMQTSVTYSIRHSAPLAWPIELPASVELLSCLVDGHPARPIVRNSGALELNLPGAVGGKDASTVTLVYAAKTKALDPISGQLSLEMPLTPLFIEHLEWSLTIPDLYEIIALDGNLAASNARPGPGQSPACRNVITLRKDFCRGERPSVALFYQRHNLEK